MQPMGRSMTPTKWHILVVALHHMALILVAALEDTWPECFKIKTKKARDFYKESVIKKGS